MCVLKVVREKDEVLDQDQELKPLPNVKSLVFLYDIKPS